MNLSKEFQADPWVLLAIAIFCEVLGTLCLRLSDGMTRLGPTMMMLTAYGISMLLVSKVVQILPLGLTYALWSGIGILAITILGVIAYQQVPTNGQLTGIALIMAGLIVVHRS